MDPPTDIPAAVGKVPDNDTDPSSGETDIEDEAETRYCVYVLLALPKCDVEPHTDDYIRNNLKIELDRREAMYKRRRVYVGKHKLQSGEPVRAREGHRESSSAFQKAPDSDQWKIYDWIAVECDNKDEMSQMEAHLFYYCYGWSKEQAGVECLNRDFILHNKASIAREALTMTKNEGYWNNPLAVYERPVVPPPDKKKFGFYVSKRKFKEYTR